MRDPADGSEPRWQPVRQPTRRCIRYLEGVIDLIEETIKGFERCIEEITILQVNSSAFYQEIATWKAQVRSFRARTEYYRSIATELDTSPQRQEEIVLGAIRYTYFVSQYLSEIQNTSTRLLRQLDGIFFVSPPSLEETLDELQTQIGFPELLGCFNECSNLVQEIRRLTASENFRQSGANSMAHQLADHLETDLIRWAMKISAYRDTLRAEDLDDNHVAELSTSVQGAIAQLRHYIQLIRQVLHNLLEFPS